MKRVPFYILALLVTIAVTAHWVKSRLEVEQSRKSVIEAELWSQEKAKLEATLKKARSEPRITTVIATAKETPFNPSTSSTPADLIKRLIAVDSTAANQIRTSRQVIHDLEELIAAGRAAVPAIREFFARNEEVDYASGQTRGLRDGVRDEFLLPPSLRFGLFDVLKQIRGPEAEKLLADTMETTGRGVELAWLARALQELAPNKYRDLALSSAHDLLARPQPTNPNSPLDRNDRDNLLQVLSLYNDTTFVSTAQAQLIQADGSLDRSALRYLQQTMGQQAVTIAATAWNDPRLTDPAKKEPLARLALTYAGADAQANDLYLKAINDLKLPKDQRRNLIEDLNQDGLPRNRKLETSDLPLIENRIALIEENAAKASDPINLAAFKEAHKDLLEMRERIVTPAKPAP